MKLYQSLSASVSFTFAAIIALGGVAAYATNQTPKESVHVIDVKDHELVTQKIDEINTLKDEKQRLEKRLEYMKLLTQLHE